MLIGQVLAAPERFRRDAPILPAWDVPAAGFEGSFGSSVGYEARSEYVPFGAQHDSIGSGGYVGVHDEYGVPHEEYGPPEVPHEEYGPPRDEYVPVVTEQ